MILIKINVFEIINIRMYGLETLILAQLMESRRKALLPNGTQLCILIFSFALLAFGFVFLHLCLGDFSSFIRNGIGRYIIKIGIK